MTFSVSAALLDACVLGALSLRQTYGYDLTQKLQGAISISESTLYPVLRRLLKEGMLSTYDEPFDGRNRRYYLLTEQGSAALITYRKDWERYSQSVERLLGGAV